MDRVRVWAELLPEVIKEQSRVRVTNVRSALKVVRCHFNAEFRNSVSRINRVEYKAINIDTLQALADSQRLDKIGIETLVAAGFISSKQLVKILGKGALTAKLEVSAHAFSKTAEAAIVAAGGTVVKL